MGKWVIASSLVLILVMAWLYQNGIFRAPYSYDIVGSEKNIVHEKEGKPLLELYYKDPMVIGGRSASSYEIWFEDAILGTHLSYVYYDENDVVISTKSGFEWFFESIELWQRDARNWLKVFGSVPPDYVTIINSRAWYSPYEMDEFEYYFQLVANDELKSELLHSGNKMQLLGLEDAKVAMENLSEEKPEWFVPKLAGSYDVYVYEANPTAPYTIFLDQMSGDIFLTDASRDH